MADRQLVNSATVTWDESTPGVLKAHAVGGGGADIDGGHADTEYVPPPPPPEFFGAYTMAREFWAEDPAWTAPADGGNIVTVRDNGTVAADLAQTGTTTPSTYQAVGPINSKPCYEFTATEPGVSNRLCTATGNVAGPIWTVVVVAKFDALPTTTSRRLVDAGAPGGRCIIEVTPTAWGLYHNVGVSATGGTSDTDPHLFVFRIEANATTLTVDGAVVASDLVGGVTTPITGFSMGASEGGGLGVNASVCYAAMFNGDLPADAGYADWLAEITTYYAIGA